MSIFSELRSLVMLRRCAIALESIAASSREQTRLLLEADERRALSGFRPPPKKMEIGAFDPREASKRWRKQEVEAGRATEEELEEMYGRLD